MMLSQNYSETTLRDFYDVLFRHKRVSLLFFFAVMIAMTFATYMFSEIYRSEATLMVQLGRESVSLDPTATTGQVISIGTDKENEINSEMAILQSRELAEKVVDAIGVDMILNGQDITHGQGISVRSKVRDGIHRLMAVPGMILAVIMPSGRQIDPARIERNRDKAVQSLMQNLFVEPIKKSSIISLSYDAKSPKMARNILNRLIDLYLDMHINAHKTTGSYQFFDRQKEEIYRTLTNSENKLNNLKNSTGVSALEDQRRILLERTGSLQREWEKTQSDMAASAAAIRSLQEKLSGMPKMLVTMEISGAPNSASDELRKRLNELQLKEQELLSVFTEESIPVKEIRLQVDQARRLLEKTTQSRQITTGTNATYQEFRSLLIREESGLPSLQAKAETLKEQLQKAAEDLTSLNETQMQLTRLQREMEIEESNYRKYSASLEQSRIDHELETQKISNISVVQKASYSVKPVRPKKIMNLALGFFLGLFGGLGLAFFSEYLDHTIKKPEDINNKLQLPLLATIPLMTLPSLSSDGFPLQPLQLVSGPLRANDRGTLSLSIETRERSGSLREFLLQPFGSPPKTLSTIAVTSCHSGEGVSTVVAYIARLLAKQRDGRVFIVDAHLGRPAGSADLKSLVALLPDLKSRYSYIIFDLPALHDDVTGILLASVMDRVVLVVEAESTRWEVALDAKERLLEAKANVLGVILNKRRYHVPEWLYKTL